MESGGCDVWRGRAVTVCTVRLVTMKCRCQPKGTKGVRTCGCVKRSTPHSSIERLNIVYIARD